MDDKISRKTLANGAITWRERRKQKKELKEKWRNQAEAKKRKIEESKKVAEVEASSKDDSNNNTSKGRHYTVSIAVPGSIVDNAQSQELKTYLCGQIARAAAVFNIDEIVVFDELGVTGQTDSVDDQSLKLSKKRHGCTQLIRILQFLECPQYLRRYFFPLHSDLEYAGLLNPLNIPHHLREHEECKYREGIILNKPVRDGKGSFVYIGVNKTAIIDKALSPNIRVTVKLDNDQSLKKHLKGSVVSPSTPVKKDGIYWGYSVRSAKSFGSIFAECPYKGGYDLLIGTSENGDNIDEFIMPPFKHLIIVFGGLKGLEYSLEADEALNVNDPQDLFTHYLNACPIQGSRTIRTEEALLITLSTLRPKIIKSQTNL